MRILHISDGSIYNYDGVSTYINELLEFAGKNGTELLVISPPPLHPERLRKVAHKATVREYRKLSIFSTSAFNFSVPRGLKKDLENFNPDVIWIHTIGPLGLRTARLAKDKYRIIYTKHCFYGELWCNHLRIPFPLQWIFHMVAKIAENRILKSSRIAIYHNNIAGAKDKVLNRFRCIPPPISERFLKGGRNIVKESGDKITIGFCGRLDPEKCLEQLFRAADIYLKKYGEDKIRILLIGDGSEAEKLVKKYSHVSSTVTGFVDDVIPYLEMLDAFVLSSKTETSSLASIEAYSRGLPVFTTRVGFLGQNPDKFPQIYNFNTDHELADLIHEVLVNRQLTGSVKLDDVIFSFSKLHEMATAICL